MIQMVRFAPISSNLRTFWLLRYAEELLKLVIYLIISMNLRILSPNLVQVTLCNPIVT